MRFSYLGGTNNGTSRWSHVTRILTKQQLKLKEQASCNRLLGLEGASVEVEAGAEEDVAAAPDAPSLLQLLSPKYGSLASLAVTTTSPGTAHFGRGCSLLSDTCCIVEFTDTGGCSSSCYCYPCGGGSGGGDSPHQHQQQRRPWSFLDGTSVARSDCCDCCCVGPVAPTCTASYDSSSLMSHLLVDLSPIGTCRSLEDQSCAGGEGQSGGWAASKAGRSTAIADGGGSGGLEEEQPRSSELHFRRQRGWRWPQPLFLPRSSSSSRRIHPLPSAQTQDDH